VEPGKLSSRPFTATTGLALMWNASAPLEIIPPCENDVFLSILLLAHAFARADDYYLPIIGRLHRSLCSFTKELREDLITIRPTVIFGVPFLFDRR
jgi:long-chain acyl-CoA synthetase